MPDSTWNTSMNLEVRKILSLEEVAAAEFMDFTLEGKPRSGL